MEEMTYSRSCHGRKSVNLFLHVLREFFQQHKQGNSLSTILPELGVCLGTVVEEGIETNDVVMRRNLTHDLILILELLPCLKQRIATMHYSVER